MTTNLNRPAALVGAISSSAALALPAASLEIAAQDDDSELIALVVEWRTVSSSVAQAWEAARPLNDLAFERFQATGQNIDRDWKEFWILHDEVGAGAAEDAAERLSERQSELSALIRDARPHTVAGLCAKFEVLRYWLGIVDQESRADQSCGDEFFNVFADDLSSINTTVQP